MANHITGLTFDLATPDPEFPRFTIEVDDQLPGRPLEGGLEIDTIFEHLSLLVTGAQQKGSLKGGKIFDELKNTNAAVLGPNVGEFLCRNQWIIPVELREMVELVFWGKVYRGSGRNRCVRFLYWSSELWVWSYLWIDSDEWYASDCAVVLARKS